MNDISSSMRPRHEDSHAMESNANPEPRAPTEPAPRDGDVGLRSVKIQESETGLQVSIDEAWGGESKRGEIRRI